MNLQNIEAIYPLSPFQASLLSGDLRALDRSAYCGQMICSLHGQLDSEGFERAWQQIINQYPILRTTFAWENLEKPVQLVHRQIEFSLLQHDWSGLSPEQQQELLDTLLEAEREEGFHATQAPLMRLCLCRLSNDDYYLLWSYDLLVLDNWSLPLLLEKAIAVYEGQLKGEIPQVEQGRFYQDYIAWLKQQDITQAEAFWKESLNGLNGSENLNGLFRSTDETATGYAHIQLPSGLTASLRALASEQQLDFQALVQGAWALLLSRYSGENEIVYGATVSGRPADLPGASLMIGPFSNVLPVHVRVSSSTLVVAWLKSLKVHLDDLRKYSFYPVTRWSSNKGGASHLSAFVSTVQIESSPTNGILHENGASLHVRQIQTVEQTKSPLMLIAPSQSEAMLQLSYNPAAFDDASAARLTRHFENLVTGILQHPHLPISQLSILSAPELDQLLYLFNDTAAPLPQTSIHALFRQQVLQSPKAVALSFLGSSLTYLELDRRSNQLAHHLRSLGVSPDSLVAVCLDRSLEVFIALLAILKAGAAYLPLDPSYPLARLSFMLADAGSPLLLTTEALADELPTQWTPPLLLDSEWDVIALNPDEPLAQTVVAADQLAYVMYTSGSTGTAKGVAVTHGGVLRLVTSPNYVRLDTEQTLLQLAPLTFDASTLEVWGALLNGGRLVVMPPSAPTLDEISRIIVAEGVTTLWLTAGLFHLMVDEQLEDLSQVEQLLAGGDVLSVRHVEKYLAAISKGEGRLINGYGPTENTTFTCCQVMDGNTRLNGSVPIGKPITNTQVYVLDAEMQVVPVGVVGELYIGGAGLARGYFNQPELTAERFVPHPHSTEAGARLYRTGDMVRWHEGGELEFIGRVDGQVKVRGFRIEVGEIEAVLAGHAGVREAVVLARENERGDKRLVAYVVKEMESEVTGGELKEYLRERLPEYMQVQWVVAVEELPLTANGKVDRRALGGLEVHVRGEQSYVPPRTSTEELICGVWEEVLHAERVGIDDNFFDLGGDSILTIQVIVKARAVGLELNVPQLFQYQTVHELAEELERSSESLAIVEETEPFSLISEADRGALPAGVVDAYPLTELQAGMLFHSELAPDAGQYHDIFTFHLRLPFDGEALGATLQQLLDRHPVLRTSFNFSDFSEPIQMVHEKVEVALKIEDLRDLSAAEQETVLANWMAAEKQYHFDWRQAPLIRFQIQRRAEESFQFSFSFHHAILDGWSVATMLTELFNVYAVKQAGASERAASLGTSFRDFVAAERAVLNSAEARQYWTTMLSEATQSRLPRLGERGGPARVTGHVVAITGELSRALRQLARRAGVPPKSVLLAAHLRALSVQAGSNDVLTGIVSHGRPETTDSERVLGLFLNTLPFRRRLRGGTWLELVQETFAAERELLPFRRYPMARMQQDIGNAAPLFETIFNYTHFHVYDEMQNVSGVEVLDHDGVADTNFTLAVDFSQELGGSQIRLALQYDAAELSEAQIEAVGHNYLTILESMTRRPLEHYEHQCLLSPEERQKLLYDWNDTAAAYPRELTLSELFEAQVVRTPNALAAVLEAEQVTYDELNRRANQLGHYLQAAGVGPDVLVGILMNRSVEMIVALLAIFKAGGAYVPLDPEYPDERLRFMVRDAGLELVVTQEKLSSRLSETVVKSIRLDADWLEIANESQDNPRLLASGSNLAYIIYTSGSSGRPKGAMVPHGGVRNCLQWMQQRYELSEQDAFLMHTSLNFDPSVWEVFWPLLVGGRVVVAGAGMVESRALLSYMAEQRVSCAYFVPSQLGMLVQERGLSEVSSLRYVISGGEKLPLGVMREFQELSGAELHHSYGPTETAIAATEWICEAGAERVLMGRPIGNTQVYVLDGQMEPLPVGVAGELYIGGVGVGRGYVGQAQLTAERFVPDQFSGQAGARLYRTGDLVRYEAEGKLEFVGRVDQQVKLRGYRIELGEIEAVLRRHAQVSAAVVVLNEADEDKRLVAYVVSEAEASELRQYLKAQLPDYMVPSFFVALNELPLLPNGKLDRRALPAPEGISAQAAEYAAPRTATEELLAGLWESVLRVNRVGINDNFFELGGHSLLATQVISRVRDAFGQEVALRSLFEQPTVAGLASEIEAGRGLGAELQAPPLERVERAKRLPLSFAQQRLWFLDQLEPESSFYNIPAAVRLRGVLDIEALERTLSEVVRRHEVLRTHFISIDGEPVQVIEAAREVRLAVTDLSALAEAERTVETQRLVEEESARRFDLMRGPLLRVSLLRLGEDEHVALVTMHHIVSDGWSIGVLVREVAALYAAYVRGEESPLEELPIQYADFAHWQRIWLQGEVLAAQLEYWRAELADAPTVIDLPIDKPRPPVQSYRGAYQPVALSAELSTQLRDLSRRHGSTLFMTLLAAFDVLLCRYAGQEQVLVGTPIANRNRSETEGLIGFFVNTLVLRGDLRDNPSFRELLRRVRETALGAYAHQDLPFEKLVEELQPDRDMSRSPLFQVMFALQNAPGEALELAGLSLSGVESGGETARFELMLGLEEQEGVIVGGLNYNRDLYEAETIGRLVGSYERMLQAVVADAEQSVLEIELLSEEERRQIIEGWNDTAAAYPRELTLSELFEAQVARTPNALAAVLEAEQVTYDELNRRANQLGHYLQAAGVGPDVLVGILMNRSVEMIVALLAIFKAGGAYVPLDPEYPDERLRFMVRDAGLELVVTQEKLSSRLSETVVKSIRLDADWLEIANESQDNPRLLASGSNLAYIIYTSGSSGRPKGAMVPQGGVSNCLQWMQQRYELSEQDAFLMHTSLNFDPSVWEVFWPLLVGGRVVVAGAGMVESRALLSYMAEQRVSCAYFVPSQLGMLVQERRLSEVSSLRYVISGGEKLPLGVMREFQELSGAELHHSYGPTETAIAATEWICEAGAERVLMGRPIGNTQVYVLDGHLEPLPVGVAGELYIGGVGVGRGYVGQAQLTAERFVPDQFSGQAGARLYRTGDLVRYEAEGKLEFVGRVDQQVKLRGYRIELGEIEAVLRRHAQVSAAVVVLNEADEDKRLVAYVVSEAEAGELRQYLKAQLPDYMVPSFFVALNELPLLPNGKLDRRALPAPEGISAQAAEYAAPRTATEELLTGLWESVLRVNRVGINDNFFELGGHSLLATQVISRVRDAFGQEVALRSLFEQPTVAGLASEIEAGRGLGAELQAPPLERVERAKRLPLSFAQQRLWFLDQLEPESSFYNIPAAVRLRGVLDIEALERTLSEVVRRHEVLRTHFISIDGEPVQVIEAAAPLRLAVLDLSGMEEEAREAEMLRLVRVEASQPFDLSRGPLLRVSLMRLGTEEHVALVMMHHIVSDGWSIGIFINEVATLYKAFTAGEESPLEELPIQYADFAHWQRTWLQGEVLAAQLEYWRAELADAPTVIDLPIDKPRPPVQTYRGAYQPVALSAELSTQLRDLSRRHGSTLFMTLLAAFDVLLCRYAGQEQVLVGTPIANRNRSETEGLIGFFVNTLVLRGDLRDNPSFRELLRRVRETALGAYAHQDLPFEKLVEELQPDRDMSRSPLFQVMFVLQNAPGEALELAGLSLSGVENAGETAKFEMLLGLQEVGGVVVGSINYNRDLFEAETIGRLVASYERILQAVVADAEQSVFEIELLSEEERRQIIEGWNETRREYAPALTLSELFEAQAARTPEAVALRFEDTALSYGELNERANQLAHYLQRTGVGPDVLVGILMNRSVEMIVAVLGILKAGGAYVPLDPSYPLERLAFMVQDSGLRMLLTQELLRDVAGEYVGDMLSLTQQWDLVAGESVENLASGALPENLAYIIYTSGSTGRPKGVMVQQRSVVNLSTALHQTLYKQYGPQLRIGLSAPLAFDASVKQLVQLLYGHTLCILPDEARADERQLLSYIKRYRLDSLDCTPSHLKLLGPGGVAELLALAPQLVLVGGEALEETVWPRLADSGATRFFNIYGPTECTVDATVSEVRAELPASTIGRPLPNVQVYVLDQRRQPAGIGIPGEIYIGGEGVGRGYLNQPALTAERFIPHPFSTEAGARLYRTGDVGRYLRDGNIEHLGRLDDQVKLRGFRIELGEIEAVLMEQQTVREAVVIARVESGGEKRLVAYLVSEDGVEVKVEELRQALRAKLPEYMVPSAFVVLEELPLTSNGKLDRRALPVPDGMADVEYEAPGTELEEELASLWSDILKVERVGINHNFFDLGGHSLLATRLIFQLREHFHVDLSLRALFEAPTIATLAPVIVQSQIEQIDSEDTAQILSAIQQS